MSEWEIYAKKIETLTKVARLLGDQIQAQNKVITKLQNDVELINQKLAKVIQNKELELPDLGKIIDTPDPKKTLVETSEVEPVKDIPEKKSEKEELLQALKIVDNL